MTDTIFALSSGRLPAGVAVVRLSGPQALDTLRSLAGMLPPPRVATLAALRDPAGGSLIDRGLVLMFPAPASFTGEDVVELHVHGGPAVLAALLRSLAAVPGLRLAEPGEFSRRAFDNAKLDLSQAEGLADLIGAATEAQRIQALAQTGGRLRDRAEDWRQRLLRLQAGVEALLDFSDEEDVDPFDPSTDIAALATEIVAQLDDGRVGERIRDGFTIAIVGPPNAGKSTLVNALARRDVAIVSEQAGTTRDAIEVALDIAGFPVTIVDTAGLRDTDDGVEAEGIRRARARAAHADLVLHVAEHMIAAPLGQLVVNKSDRSGARPGARDGVIHLSAATGEGLDELEAWLAQWLAGQTQGRESALVTQQRHRDALTACAAHLHSAEVEADPVLRAESLRLAARSLGRITGRVGVEDMLGALFGRFCIGK